MNVAARFVAVLFWLFAGTQVAPANCAITSQTHITARPLTAPTPRLTLQIEPAAVTIEAGARADLILVAHNPGTAAIAAASLCLLVSDGVKASADPAKPLSGSGDLVWTIHLAAGGAAPPDFSLVAEATYVGKAALPDTDLAEANITVSVPADLASSVKSTLLPSDGSVDQFNPLGMTVQLQNTGLRDAAITGLMVLSPPYVQVEPPDHTPIKIQAGFTGAVNLDLHTAHRVVPGTYMLVLGYTVQPVQGSAPAEEATVSGKVTISIPGVSDVMQLLGVSSFLLLPGALTVVAFFGFFARSTGSKEVDWKSPTMVLIAVTLSMFFAVGYPFLVSRFFPSSAPDYLGGYDFADAAVIWFGSCALGAISGLLAGKLSPLVAGWQKRWEPNENDKPIDILRKLDHHKAGFSLKRWKKRPTAAGAAPDPEAFLLLPFGKAPSGQRWVIKHARATISPTHQRGALAARAKILNLLASRNARPDTMRKLYSTVKMAVDAEQIKIEWPGNFQPLTVPVADYMEDTGQTDRLFDF